MARALRRGGVRSVLIGVVAAAALAPCATAGAATLTVDSTADPSSVGHCTLRDAINSVNSVGDQGGCTATGSAYGADDTIDIAATGTITLGSELPTVKKSVTIAGPGAAQLTVSGADNYAAGPFINSGTTVVISGLTIAHGSATSGSAGITSNGILTLTDDAVTDNSGASAAIESGGGFVGGALTIVDTTLSGNTTTAAGASAEADGGAIFTNGPLTVAGSTISDNTAMATATGVGNFAIAEGGGIAAAGMGQTSISRSTISGNTAFAAGSGGATASSGGGGMSPRNATNSVSIVDSTVTANSAGIGSNIGGNFADAQIGNTIVSNPQGAGASCGASETSLGYNLEDDAGASCGFSAVTHDLVGVDPMLAAALAENGGATETFALQTGSPAIDAGKAIGTGADLTSDQRGDSRPSDFGSIVNAIGGDGSDIGAFEAQVPRPSGSTQAPPGSSPPLTCMKHRVLKHGRCVKKKRKKRKK